MSILINPGSRLADASKARDWTNTYAVARALAEEWLAKMRAEGIADVDLVDSDETERDGRWRFTFRHAITGVEAVLETHGINDVAAYQGSHLFGFAPRIYWCDSSTANPSLSDFAAPGYVMTFRADPDPHRPERRSSRP